MSDLILQKPIRSVYKDGSIVVSNVKSNIDNTTTSYTVIAHWFDGTEMDDTKVDQWGVYSKFKETGEYVRENRPQWGELFLEVDTVADLRAMSAYNQYLIWIGYYKGVRLNGYYIKDDTPYSLEYFLSTTTINEDGGSIFQIGNIKLQHKFISTCDIRHFGAKGNGIDNDRINVQNAVSYCSNKKVKLLVSTGSYLVNGGYISVTGGIHVLGNGCATSVRRGLSRFVTTDITGDLFNFTNSGEKVILEQFSIENISPDIPVEGSIGLNFQNADCTEFKSVSVINFCDNIYVKSGIYYNFNGLYIFDPIRNGIVINNVVHNDIGDMSFDACYFIINYFSNRSPSGAAIKWNSGGGLRVTNCKINFSGNAKWLKGIDINPQSTSINTSVFVIQGNSIENCKDGIIFHNDGIQSRISKVVIQGNEMMVTDTAIRIDGTTSAGGYDSRRFEGFVINANKIDGQYGVVVNGASSVNVTGNEFNVSKGTAIFGVSCYYCSQSGNTLNPMGHDVRVYQNGQTDLDTTYCSEVMKFDRSIPSGATTSNYVSLFKLGHLQNYRNCRFRLDIDATAEGYGATYISHNRLFSAGATTGIVTVIGTDYVMTPNVIDIQYVISGNNLEIKSKINSGGNNATSLHGKVTLTIEGGRIYSVNQF